MKAEAELLVHNASELVTLAGPGAGHAAARARARRCGNWVSWPEGR